MIYKIKIATHSDSVPREFELNRDKTLLGRREENHIQIKERYVSSYHASFFYDKNRLFLEDCGSKNGIYLNGDKVNDICQINCGDKICIGELVGEIEMVADSVVEPELTELSAHHERERNIKGDDSDLTRLQQEVEHLAALKQALQDETSHLAEARERLAKDHDDLNEDLWDTRKKIDGLIDLESELQESVGGLQANTMSRKKVFSNGDDLKCVATEKRICRDLIRWLENLEDAQKEAQPNLLMNRTTRKLTGLEGDFVEMLAHYSVKRVDFEPGSEISMQCRSKIQLISIDEIEDAKLRKEVSGKVARLGEGVVLRTLSPGFVYENDGKQHVLRKAEVVVA